jgi:hypothetical protein
MSFGTKIDRERSRRRMERGLIVSKGRSPKRFLGGAAGLAVALLVCAVLALPASAAQAAAPQFVINPIHYPTNAAPGGTVLIRLDPINEGTAATSGTMTVTYALPPGFTATEMLAEFSGLWTCSVATLTCTTSGSLPPGATGHSIVESLGEIVVTASVAPDAASGVGVATVSGGGAETVTAADPIAVSAVPAPFGVRALSTSVVDADGRELTQAGGHPFRATGMFSLNTHLFSGGSAAPSEYARSIVTDLPPGFIGNPQAAAQCANTALVQARTCPEGSQVGNVVISNAPPHSSAGDFTLSALYNMKPDRGQAAQFAFANGGGPVTVLTASVRSDSDYGVRLTAPAVPQTVNFTGIVLSICGYGAASGGSHFFPTFACNAPTPGTTPFLSNPTDCGGPIPTTGLTVNSWENPAVKKTASFASPPLSGCDQLSFEPMISVTPESTKADQPTGLGVHIHIPQVEETGKPATPPLRNAVVTLPQGVVVNPSLAEGLQGCTDAQWSEHDGEAGKCPEASKIGSLEVTTPLLDHKLPGSLYIRQPDTGASRANGLYTLFLEVDDPISGVIVKLRGSVVPDEKTGQLTASFADNPQLPFSDLDLSFKGGPNGALITPSACGSYTTQTQLTPWAGPTSTAATPTSSFTVDGCGSGGFKPGFEAGTTDTGAGHYSSFNLRVTRSDGGQNISSIDATLPVGLTAKLAGVPLCGEGEAATGNCPAASQIGTTTVGVGAGSNLLYVPQSGKAPTGVYLAGPYKGGPYSLVVKVPAQAGPFDLGTVAVRSAINIDPESAQVSVKSDPLPQILEGVPVAYRDVRVSVDRNQFILNPTNCNQMSVTGQIHSAQNASAGVSSPFKVGGCDKLGFAPKLQLSLKGSTKHAGHPALTAVVKYPQQGAYANIARAQVNLPHSEFLDQGNLNKTCTKPVLLEGKCPATSIYGKARAWTPLLEKPLEGPVYLVGGYGYKLPALVADLNGQIRVVLKGKVDSGPNKGIRNTFEAVPDAPVEKFVLEMKGGKKYSLLENSENLCAKPQHAIARFTAQNGMVAQTKPLIANDCKKAGAKKGGKKKHK